MAMSPVASRAGAGPAAVCEAPAARCQEDEVSARRSQSPESWPLATTYTWPPSELAPGLARTTPPRDRQPDQEPLEYLSSQTASFMPRTKTSKTPLPGDATAGPPRARPPRWMEVDQPPVWVERTAWTSPWGEVTATISWPSGAWAAPGLRGGEAAGAAGRAAQSGVPPEV